MNSTHKTNPARIAERFPLILVVVCLVALGALAGCRIVRFIRADELNQAVSRGDKAAVERAISNGIDLNVPGMHAVTPLMSAAEAGQTDICRDLIRNGADVNGHNESGSVLMYAIGSGNAETLAVVLAAKPDLKWTNALGDSAESFAKEIGDTNALEMLREK